MLHSALQGGAEGRRRLTGRQDASGGQGDDAARQQRAHLERSAGNAQRGRTEVPQRFMNNPGTNTLAVHNGSKACPQTGKTRGITSQPAETTGRLPRAVVKVRVPRGPGAVEGERQLLVVLVLLTPHPKGREHLVCTPHRQMSGHEWASKAARRASLCWWRMPAGKHTIIGSSRLLP